MPWKRLLSIVEPVAVLFDSFRGHKPKSAESKPNANEGDPAAPAGFGSWGKQLIVGQTHTACRQARMLDRKYFILGQAPHLPLEGCDSERCQCWYKVLPDLRSGQERRFGLERRVQHRVMTKADRRNDPDRRDNAPTELHH
jgi:hypothetical protein